jgi:hypothetical protein
MVDCTITIASDSNPSDAISTSPRSFLLIFYLPLLLHTENNIVPRSLAFCKTLYRLDLTHTVFYCVPRLYPVYINLDTLRSTSLYCVLLAILCFSSHFISFTSISFNLLILTSDSIYGHIPTITHSYPIAIEPDIHLFYHPFFILVIARNRYTRTLHPLDHS